MFLHRLFGLHLALLPLTNVFAFNAYFNLGNTSFIIVSILVMLGNKRFSKDKLTSYYTVGIILALVATIIAILFNQPGNLGHAAARLYYVAGFFGYSLILRNLGFSKVHRDGVLLGLLFVVMILLLEYLNLIGTYNFPFDRIGTKEIRIPVFNWFRLRGPTEEPTYLAAYVTCVAIFMFYYGERNWKVWLLLIATFLLTFSVSLLLYITALLLLLLVFRFRRYSLFTRFFGLLVLLLSLYVFVIFLETKLSGRSVTDRLVTYQTLSYMSDLGSYLFGLGPGFYKYSGEAQPTNLVLSTLLEIGIFGLGAYLFLWFFPLFSNGKGNLLYSISAIAFLIYFLTTGLYYHLFMVLPLTLNFYEKNSSRYLA